MSELSPTTPNPLHVNYPSDLGPGTITKDVRGRLPSDGDQSIRFKSARIFNNLPYSMYIFVDGILVIEVYANKTVIQYKDSTGTCRSIAGIYTNDGQSIRVDAVGDPCFWFSCNC